MMITWWRSWLGSIWRWQRWSWSLWSIQRRPQLWSLKLYRCRSLRLSPREPCGRCRADRASVDRDWGPWSWSSSWWFWSGCHFSLWSPVTEGSCGSDIWEKILLGLVDHAVTLHPNRPAIGQVEVKHYQMVVSKNTNRSSFTCHWHLDPALFDLAGISSLGSPPSDPALFLFALRLHLSWYHRCKTDLDLWNLRQRVRYMNSASATINICALVIMTIDSEPVLNLRIRTVATHHASHPPPSHLQLFTEQVIIIIVMINDHWSMMMVPPSSSTSASPWSATHPRCHRPTQHRICHQPRCFTYVLPLI